MGLRYKGVTILHFDETYYAQHRLLDISHQEIHLQNIERVHLYCEQASLAKINRRLQRRKQRGITFIGSGNYHYVTYLFLQELTEPFTLVLFDNHPDLGIGEAEEKPLFSCGSWVYYALEDLPFLQKAVIIGPTLKQLPSHPRADIYRYDDKPHLQSILQTISTNQIYISIDKDVLRKEDVKTNWDQGRLDLVSLCNQLSFFLKHKTILGVDICGEFRMSPADRLEQKSQIWIEKNEQANIQLLQTCLAN
ncbi:arginase family protein [Lederbergia sp. NSJ-179]|uniref:arginase family protein n=1 Tax=Lederbergia sp. NSJ-179 TaxID=2931402 RepID=UPI001FD37BF3|nr:arginase family protein [Lederbergia sp. NSJ-179]MCJ7841026.1 arginase family protein [Lederbergia sp. NSJ-179]